MKKEITWKSFQDEYTENNIKNNVSEKSGVYLLWVKLKNGKWECFYVGQAKNLKTRLLEHLSENEENECVKKNVTEYKCGYEYSEINIESDRNGIEKFLYENYETECNKISPPSKTSIKVNLP